MPKVGGKRKKTRTHVPEQELDSNIPRSLIIKRGKVGPYLKKLVSELRTVMYPYTAINLKEKKSNNMRDFLSLVDIYGYSHMMMLTNTDKHSYLHLAKMPRGPTITFKIDNYCLNTDIFNAEDVKHKKPLNKNFDHIPIIVMNNFNFEKIPFELETPIKTANMLFQSFFPPLNLNQIQISKCKRLVLLNLNLRRNNMINEEEGESEENSENNMSFNVNKNDNSTDINSTNVSVKNNKVGLNEKDEENDKNNDSDEGKESNVYVTPVFEFRHYDIEFKKHSVKKTISNLINNINLKKDLSSMKNIADYVLKHSGFTSASDNEEDLHCDVISGKENKKEDMSIKLTELGPRMNLSLFKIQEGFFKGNVIYHSIIKKSKKETIILLNF